MYKQLLPHINQFVYLRQGGYSRYYEGKLLAVTPEAATIQSYNDEGLEEATWTVSMSSISEFMVGDRDLTELKMKVCLAKTLKDQSDHEEEVALEEAFARVANTYRDEDDQDGGRDRAWSSPVRA